MPSTLDLAARLSAIVAANQDIVSRVPDTAQVMSIAARQAQQITDADGAVVEQIEGEDLVYRGVSGGAVAKPGMRLKIAGSVSGLALTSRESIRCDDAETDKRVDREACKKLGLRSMIVVPLIHRDRAYGVLKSFSERANFFDDLDTYSVELIGGTTSIAPALSDEALHRQTSEERYRLLFEKNVAGVFRTTRDGRMLDCNDAFAGCLGYASRAELLARPAWDLYPQRADREALLEKLDRERAMTNVRLPLKKKDGSAVTGLVNVSLIPGDGEEQQLLGTLVCG